MPTLRHHLAQAGPPVALKAAWKAYLQALRADERQAGRRGVHRDRAAVERALDQELEADPPVEVEQLKRCLRDLVHGPPDQAGPLARRADGLLLALVGQAAAGPVTVRVTGWPAGLPAEARGALLGVADAPELRLDPGEAAALVHALHGRVLGGARLQVQVELPPGVRLPGVPRDQRDRSARGSGSWLPHLDAQGRYSASPLDLARAQARDLAVGPDRVAVVVDAFCGCGGNAIAFAQAGLRVIAIEQDPDRLAMARANARELGVALELHAGDAALLLPRLARAHPGAALFLDPPWGGPGAQGERPLDFALLVPLPAAVLDAFETVLLKAPRQLDLDTLPHGRRWTWRFELSPPGADHRAAVRCITAFGRRESTGRATG